MNEPPLGYSATIKDVLHTLRDPVEYVRGVLGNFYACGLSTEQSSVRIGVSGNGIVPNYKIEIQSNYDIYFMCSGMTHKVKSRQWYSMFGGESWSDNYMTFSEVRDLLGQLRGVRRQR